MYWLGRYLDPVTLTYILRSSAFYTFYVDVQYLLNYKAFNHQTLHRTSPQCTDTAGTLTGWPWPIFRAPLTLPPFTSPFHMSSTVRPSTTKPYIVLLLDVLTQQPASVAQLDAPSDWRPGGRGFNPRWGRQHSFMEIDHEIFSTVILSLPLIQEGQLSVSGERMCTILVNRLED